MTEHEDAGTGAAGAPGGPAASPRQKTPPELWSRAWRMVLTYGVALALAIGVIGAVLGGIFAGTPGVWGGIIGAGMAAVFLGITAATMFFGRNLSMTGIAGALMFGFLFKAVLFLILASRLSRVEAINGTTLFLTLVAAVLGTAVLDAVIVQKSRIPYVDPDATA